jgi:hypothetical protein
MEESKTRFYESRRNEVSTWFLAVYYQLEAHFPPAISQLGVEL